MKDRLAFSIFAPKELKVREKERRPHYFGRRNKRILENLEDAIEYEKCYKFDDDLAKEERRKLEQRQAIEADRARRQEEFARLGYENLRAEVIYYYKRPGEASWEEPGELENTQICRTCRDACGTLWIYSYHKDEDILKAMFPEETEKLAGMKIHIANRRKRELLDSISWDKSVVGFFATLDAEKVVVV
jgi:hypothetical protein